MALKPKMNPEDLLKAEYEYIAQTAYQANEDRARGASFYFVSVGSIVAAILGTQFTDADPGKEYQAGIGQGVSNAMDRLAQYYISLADKTHPVIEIDAGRRVDIGFTKGITLDVPLIVSIGTGHNWAEVH